jgi:hypothetical protein
VPAIVTVAAPAALFAAPVLAIEISGFLKGYAEGPLGIGALLIFLALFLF